MRRESEQYPNPESLPPDFSGSLREIDQRLGRRAARVAKKSGAHDGLADRVFQASVVDLPSAAASGLKSTQRGWRPRLVSGTRRDWRSARTVATSWGRLGLAAALGFAFVLAGLFLAGPPAQPGELALDIEWLDEDPLDHVDAQVAHIIDTGSLTSVTEMTGELESILASLEM